MGRSISKLQNDIIVLVCLMVN